MNTNPKVPMTRVVICVFASRANLASPKSETYNIKNWSTKIRMDKNRTNYQTLNKYVE